MLSASKFCWADPSKLSHCLIVERLNRGWTQAQTAAVIGVCQITILNWESGKSSPFIRHWPQIIRFLGFDPNEPPKSYGAKILAYRLHLGMTRKELAQQAGLDEGTLLKLENDGYPKLDLRIRMAALRLHQAVEGGLLARD